MIEVDDVVVRYGTGTALDGVTLAVGAGEMVALIGANGAGKSTLLNALSRVVPTARGSIHVRGRFAHVPEGRQLFSGLSVEDNLRLGAFRAASRDTSWIYELMPELDGLRQQRADSLSGGQQQMVAIGRGLMARPDVIAIDEMSLGLAPKVVQRIASQLTLLNQKQGLGVLLVEQSARLALSLCSKAYILETGRLVAQGSSRQLLDSSSVVSAYLGSGLEAPA